MSFSLRIAIVLLILLVLEFFFIRIFDKALKSLFPGIPGKKYKYIKAAVIVFFNLYPFYLLFQYLVSGGGRIAAATVTDYLLVYPFWSFIFLMIQSYLFILPIKLVKLLILPAYKKRKERWRPIEHKIMLIIIAVFALYVPIRILYDYNVVEVRETVYTKGGLDKSLNGMKIVFISDIQADRYTDEKRLGRFISKVNEQNPDLVLMAGDVITNTPDYIDIAAEMTGKIKSRYGVYSCLGDHDHWAYRPDASRSIREITEAFKRHNLHMIDNQSLGIKVNDAELFVSFITNTYPSRAPQDLLNELITKEKKDLKILLTHQPGEHLIKLASERGYDLFLAGHTHGGQISFLVPFTTISPTLIETKYVRGDFQIGNMLMIVTRGLGMSLVPMRFNSTPEVTVIKLASE